MTKVAIRLRNYPAPTPTASATAQGAIPVAPIVFLGVGAVRVNRAQWSKVKTMATDRRCAICDRRPPAKGEMYCRVCQGEMDRAEQDGKHRCQGWKQAWKFLHWKGVVVGIYLNGCGPDGQTWNRPQRVFKNLSQLPKAKVIDLDTYIPGFTRQQIAGMKKTLKQLAPREL